MTYGAGAVLQSALGIVLLPLYLRYFAPEDYGVIAALSVTVSLLTMVLGAGMMNGLIRLYYEAQGDERRLLAGTTFLWYAAAGLVGCAGFVLLAPALSFALFRTVTHAPAVRMAGVVFLTTMARTVPLYLLRLEKQAGQYVLFSLLGFLTDFSLKIWLIVALHRGVLGFFEAGAAGSLLSAALMIPVVAPHLRIRLNLPALRQILRLGTPYVVSGISVWTLDVSDRLLLARFAGTGAIGIYSLASTFSNIFLILLGTPVTLLMDPFFFSFSARETEERTKQLLRRTLVHFLVAGGAMYLAVALGSSEVLRVLTSSFGARPEYLQAARLVPVVAAAPFLYFLTSQAVLAGLQARKPAIFSAACTTAALVNVGLNLWAIPRFGAAGAAWTTLIAYSVLFIAAYWRTERSFPIGYPWSALARGSAYLGIALAIGWRIHLASPLLSLFVRVPAAVLLFLGLIWFAGGVLDVGDRVRTKTQIDRLGSLLSRRLKGGNRSGG